MHAQYHCFMKKSLVGDRSMQSMYGCAIIVGWSSIYLQLITASSSPTYVIKMHNSRISLSTIVLNSRDWLEIVWLPKISHFKINIAIGFIQKKPAGIHGLGYNDAVSWLNEAKTRIFQPTANLKF